MSVVTKRLRELAALERERTGGTAIEVRTALASKARVAPGTIERACGNGHKSPKPELVRLVIRELEQEVQRMTHDIHIMKQMGLHLTDSEIRRAEDLLAEVRLIMGK